MKSSHDATKNIAVCADAVSAALGNKRILEALSVALRAGCWTSVVGPNGAGKSTLLRVLAGLLPHSGQVSLLGQPMRQLAHQERARQLAWLGQGEDYSTELLVWDVVMLGRLPHQSWLAAPGPLDHAAVEQALRATQTWEWRERPLNQLSGGERQRVLLARALAVQAQVLLMDEPLANLDPPHQADWLAQVHALTQCGRTVVSVLHEISLALRADQMVVMAQGSIRHQGACDDPATHRALESVFEQRIAVVQANHQWVALLQPPR